MPNLERKIVPTPVTDFDVVYQSLGTIAETVAGLIKSYGSDAKVEWHQELYDNDRYLYVFQDLPESDRDYSRRIERETEQEEYAIRREKAEYERLKSKFEGGV